MACRLPRLARTASVQAQPSPAGCAHEQGRVSGGTRTDPCSPSAHGGGSTRRTTATSVRLFYVPALEDAERYDRLTGYFNAGALALAARGIEGLVRNRGHMRLVVGCTLPPAEIEAIERGAKLRDLVERHLTTLSLAPPDQHATDALELLAWMVARGHLDVKVAVPCDLEGTPIPEDGIFHEKAGIVTDRTGDPARLERQPQRDRGRLAAQLGEHQRLHELGPGAAAGFRRAGQLRAHLGQ